MNGMVPVRLDCDQESAGVAEATLTFFLSPQVRDLAASVYQEFKRLVECHGEGVVDGIAPIIINALEKIDELNEAYEASNASAAVIEANNKDILGRLNREVTLRRASEERIIAMETEFAAMGNSLENQIKELTGLVRILQAKHKSAADHAARLEEKECDLHKELTASQARYSELLRTHMAHIDCSRRIQQYNHVQQQYLGIQPRVTTQIFNGGATSTITYSTIFNDLPQNINTELNYSPYAPLNQTCGDALNNELKDHDFRKLPHEGFLALAPSIFPDADASDYERHLAPFSQMGPTEDTDDLVSSISATTDDFDLCGIESIENEVKKLIIENQDLIETKNALNILKDDLLTKVNDLTREGIVCRDELDVATEEITDLKQQASSNKQYIRSLEKEVKRLENRLFSYEFSPPLSPDNNNLQESVSSPSPRHSVPNSDKVQTCILSDERDIADAKLKLSDTSVESEKMSSSGSNAVRFTRREMVRVVVERNYYKRKFLDLCEAVTYSESLRASAQPLLTLQSLRSTSSTGSAARADGSPNGSDRHFRLSHFASRVFGKVHAFASDFVQGFDELVSDADLGRKFDDTLLTSSLPAVPAADSRNRTSSALWNLLGDFIGQVVTRTADVMIGTGSGLPHEVSKLMIATKTSEEPSPRLLGRAIVCEGPFPSEPAIVQSVSATYSAA